MIEPNDILDWIATKTFELPKHVQTSVHYVSEHPLVSLGILIIVADLLYTASAKHLHWLIPMIIAIYFTLEHY